MEGILLDIKFALEEISKSLQQQNEPLTKLIQSNK